MIRLGTLFRFYRRHLRVQPLRELMAVVGVAAGVALLFAVQVANSSVTGAFEQVVHGVAGHATLEVAARSPEGFSETIGEQIESTPGIKAAAPVLTQQVIVAGPKGSEPVTLVGADERLETLGGQLIARFERYAEVSRRGLLVLTQPTAEALGVKRSDVVAIRIGERTEHLALDAIVPDSQLGPLAESPIAATSLPVAQTLSRLPDRITRVLIEPSEGREAQVRRTLDQRFGGMLNVRPVDTEVQLLSDAAKPEAQLTALFSAISLVVGIILAYNALLLASGERRVFIAYLVQLGTPDSSIIASLAFDALILGLLGSILGLLAGDAISLLAYRAPPGYLTAAFPIGGQRIVSLQTVVIALGAGLFAAFAAAALPAISLLRSSAIAPDPERVVSLLRRPSFSESAVFGSGALLLCVSVIVSLLWAEATVVALVALAVGLVLCMPATVRFILKLARAASKRSGDPSARLASGEMKTSPTRTVALLATGTIAVFLMVTISGAVADVQRAVRAGAEETGSNADLWIRPGGAENVYGTQPFAPAQTQRQLQRLPAVSSVLAYRNSFLDLTDRRVWVNGIPPQAPSPIAESQLVKGPPLLAVRRLREGGWAVISQTIATEHHVGLGERFILPTPSGPASFRLAATISNYGWLPGTILLNADDYSRLWRTTSASQLAVTLKPGVPLAEGKLAVEHALPAGSALGVQTAEERQKQVSTVLGSTLSRLDQTSAIVLIAAIATVIAMMISAVWQRRGRLDTLVSMGMSFGQLARLVFYESGCVLLAGCLIGVASGIIGQYLIDSWLRHSTGSPIVFSPAWTLGLRTVLVAIAISIIAAMIAVLRTFGFRPKTAFSTE
ncbi:MAG TPA: FtsX-like permease family protein [Solirubrobacteraceae bacterium]|jgi:putative ABC transport system permease protein|nr:FtsX-like permease family protein [Solirubrobacteraceae bacterium]